ncbi:MAG TPA: MobF family relaxase [Acidiphilium rubrum]|nr:MULTISPECIES: MobF family relaxase [Acidiphilium]HQT84972.1 MobF family relaxase [Acidiphilium rubrum]
MADHVHKDTIDEFRQQLAGYYQSVLGADAESEAMVALGAGGQSFIEPRRDMDSAVASALGIDLSRPITRDEVANLLSGNRADGAPIAGKQYQRAVSPLSEIFGLDPDRPATRDELENVLDGKRADGSPLPVPEGATQPAKPSAGRDEDYDGGMAAEMAVMVEMGGEPAGPPDGAWIDQGPAGLPPDAGREDEDYDAGMAAEMAAMAERGGEPAIAPRGPIDRQEDEPRVIDVAAALDAAGIRYQKRGSHLRIQATWRGGDGLSVSVNATTGQWKDFAADEGGRFESLARRLGVSAEARGLDGDEAAAARAEARKFDQARRSIAGKLWAEAVPGKEDRPEPLYRGSAGQMMRQRHEHAERIAAAEAMAAPTRAYLEKRGLDADWLLRHVRLTRLHPNYDSKEIEAGATVAMLTPMYGQDEAGQIRLTGVQRTYLTEDGEKVGRRMLGAAGAWLLAPPPGEAMPIAGHDKIRLAGEGFETVASVVQATRQEGLVGYNAGGVVAWAEQYHGSTPIGLLADRDQPKIHNGRNVGEAGQKAAAKSAGIIEANGGETVYLEPPASVTPGPKGADWADALRQGGEAGLRAALDAATGSSAADRARIEAVMAPKLPATETPIGATEAAAEAGQTIEATAPEHPELVRLRKALGAADGRKLTAEERANILDGNRADGGAMDPADWRKSLTRSKTPIGYVDFTFSADKTVSIAWAFAPTEAERSAICQAHREAVHSALLEIEQVIGQARKGKGGMEGIEAGKIGWVAFDHYTARPTVEIARQTKAGVMETELVKMRVAGDMQLHTHVTVPNTIVTESGRVVSLNTMEMHGRIHEWGAIYQAHLAQNLRRLGADVELDRTNGAARLSAVPETARAAFSKRTRDALADAKDYAKANGADWDKLSPDERIKLLKSGAHATRLGKTDDMSDFESWTRQAVRIGYQHRSVIDLERKAKPISEAERLDCAYDTAASLLGDQFERRAVLKPEDERVAAARGLIASGIESGADVDRVIARIRERGVDETGVAGSQTAGQARIKTPILVGNLLRQIVDAQGNEITVPGEERLTTRAHFSQEAALIDLAGKHASDTRGGLTPNQLAQGVAASGLQFEGEHGAAQYRLMKHLGTGGRFAVGIGAAGAGKTTLLKPLVAAWHERGQDVHGISLGWRQARELREAGLNTEANTGGRDTIAATSVFINRVKSGSVVLTHQSVVVVDELGTIGTRQLLELLRLQDQHGFRMVAIGDPKQCQSIESGQVIGLLEKSIAVPGIETSVRQTDDRAREIAALLRKGGAENVAKALTMKREDKTAEIVPGGHAETIERAAALWQERKAANADRPRYTVTISTPSNEDARAIGEAIRARLQATGELGGNRKTLAGIDPNTGTAYAMPVAIGERVRLFARTNAAMLDGGKGAIGDNGSILTIIGFKREGVILRNDKGSEGVVKWETLADKKTGRMRLTYGYAQTTNTAQGDTTTEHIFVMPGGSKTTDGFKTYVSGSRHRERDYWLTSEGAEKQEISARRPLGDPRPITVHDLWDNWTRNISKRPEKTNATDIIATADQTRRTMARSFLDGVTRREAQAAKAERADDLQPRFQQARIRVTENGRISEGMANVSRFRQAAIERLDRTAPAVRAAVAGTWEKTRPVIEHATASMRERLNRALGDYRQREDQRRIAERRQAAELRDKKIKAKQEQVGQLGLGRS